MGCGRLYDRQTDPTFCVMCRGCMSQNGRLSVTAVSRTRQHKSVACNTRKQWITHGLEENDSRRGGSNPRPAVYETAALPTELRRRGPSPGRGVKHAESQGRTGDTRIFSPLLYQLSYLGAWLLSGTIVAARALSVKPHGASEGDLQTNLQTDHSPNACRRLSSTRRATSACMPGRTWE
jgi:hypothetical protein